MALKLNSAETYEPITIIIIDKEQYPICYNNKINELVKQGAYETIEQAEKDNPYFIFDCELYYHEEYGLFAVEQGAVETGTIYSPYNGKLCEDV